MRATGSPTMVLQASAPSWWGALPGWGALGGGVVGTLLGGPVGGGIGATVGGMTGKGEELSLRARSSLPPPPPTVVTRALESGVAPNGLPAPVRAAADVLSSGITEGIIPEAIGAVPAAGINAATRLPGVRNLPIFRAGQDPANRAVIETNREFGLGLSAPEQLSTVERPSIGRTVVHTIGDQSIVGRRIAQGARDEGQARAEAYLTSRLDRIAGKTDSPAALGTEVQGVLARRQAAAQAGHEADQAVSRSAHQYLQDQARIAHEAEQTQLRGAHAVRQKELRGKYEAAQQFDLNQALAGKKAAGAQMEAVEQAHKDTAVSITNVKAKAQDILDREFATPETGFPRATPGEPSAAEQQLAALTASNVPPSARNQSLIAMLQGITGAGGGASDADAIARATGAVRQKLHELANADDVVTFAQAAEWRKELIEASGFLKKIKSRNEGRITALNQEISAALGKAAPDWEAASTGYRTAMDTLRTANKPRPGFKPEIFKETPFKEAPFVGQKFTPDPEVARILAADPSTAVRAIGDDPARIYAARDTLTHAGRDAQGTAVWDRVRRHWVESTIVGDGTDLAGMAKRLKAVDPETLKAYVGDQPAMLEDLKKLATAFGRESPIAANQWRNRITLGTIGTSLAAGRPDVAASAAISLEAIPAFLSWAARRPGAIDAVLGELKLPKTAATTAAFARLVQGFVESQQTEAADKARQAPSGPPPAPSRARGAGPGASGPPPVPGSR